MTVREFVGEANILQNFVGEPDAPEWDLELSEEEMKQLGEDAYLDLIEEGHRELVAFKTARQGSSIYAPDELPPYMEKLLKVTVPLSHVFAFYGIRGNARTGTY